MASLRSLSRHALLFLPSSSSPLRSVARRAHSLSSRAGVRVAQTPWAVLQGARALHASASHWSPIGFQVPDIGEGIFEVEIKKWHVKPGDKIKAFDLVCEVSSDKASVDIKSMYDGTITKLYFKDTDIVKVGSVIFDIEPADGSGAQATSATTTSSSPSTPSTSAPSPSAAPPASETAENHKYLMTPAVRRLVSEHKVDLRRVVPTGREVGPGEGRRILKEDVLKHLEGRGVAAGAAAPTQRAAAPAPTPSPTHATSSPSPPLSSSTPTATTAAEPTATIPKPPASVPASRLTPAVPPPADTVVPLRGVRRAMAKSMTAALKVPTFGYCDEIEMDELIALRSSLKAAAAQAGVKLSFMPFLLKAVSLALSEHPILNAHVNDDCTAVTMRSNHNIGVAMDTPDGLLVPNIKGVQALSILDIAMELNRLQELGAAGKLGAEHLTGGTFSLSNIGVVGGTYTRPVLLVPEVCIGAFGKTRRLPRFNEKDQVVPASIMEVSWSADHRVIDGMTVAKFSNKWKHYVENPSQMLLYLK